jgi:hypothetical protein
MYIYVPGMTVHTWEWNFIPMSETSYLGSKRVAKSKIYQMAVK